jgi:hypothetical protein
VTQQPLFAGLVIDEDDQPVEVANVGDDHGFRRHIPSEQVDREILRFFFSQMEGKEDLLSAQAAKMMGQEDIFTRAVLTNQFKHIDEQLDTVLKTGIPVEGRQYLGMMGLRIIINVHGEIVRIDQPAAASGEEGGDE